ncbi:MAG: hypothetical protein KDA89_21495 [Planctomycetaceae bacterium]|nr:hypothetical protein [Planctomycetaceae bacterium]
MSDHEPNLFLSEQHPVSRRWATVEDHGTCAFLYLSEPDQKRPIGDCWLYNRVPAPKPSEVKNFRPNPPPAAVGYVGPDAQMSPPGEGDVELLWSSDGEAVAVLLHGMPLGLLIAGESGMSLHLIKSGPWGEPWDQSRFDEIEWQT